MGDLAFNPRCPPARPQVRRAFPDKAAAQLCVTCGGGTRGTSAATVLAEEGYDVKCMPGKGVEPGEGWAGYTARAVRVTPLKMQCLHVALLRLRAAECPANCPPPHAPARLRRRRHEGVGSTRPANHIRVMAAAAPACQLCGGQVLVQPLRRPNQAALLTNACRPCVCAPRVPPPSCSGYVTAPTRCPTGVGAGWGRIQGRTFWVGRGNSPWDGRMDGSDVRSNSAREAEQRPAVGLGSTEALGGRPRPGGPR